MSCDKCPCPDICLGRPDFCNWASSDDTSKHFHICERSRIAAAQFPPLATQAANALGALGRVARAAVTGQALKADESVVDARRATCAACEHMVGSRCKLCGCALAAKILLATEKCPEGKWSA